MGSMDAQTRPLTTRVLNCSNALCEYHKTEAIFSQIPLVKILYDVLQPGAFGIAMCGGNMTCRGCGWSLATEEGKKPFTTPAPEGEK